MKFEVFIEEKFYIRKPENNQFDINIILMCLK